MADRIYVTKKVYDKLIPEIDRTNFLGLGKPVERLALFMFAASIGIAEGKRTPLESRSDLVLEAVINKDHHSKSEMFAVLINQAIKDQEEDRISDKDYAYVIIQEYANTGFNMIESWMKDMDQEMVMLNLLVKLDQMHKEISEQQKGVF